jgi:ankyrin repeat protein
MDGRKMAERLKVSNDLPPLMRAACDGDIVALQNLLDQRVSINSKDQYGATALMYASVANQPKVVSLLLSKGAKKSLKTNKGNTAMFFAVQEKHNEIITLLSN